MKEGEWHKVLLISIRCNTKKAMANNSSEEEDEIRLPSRI